MFSRCISLVTTSKSFATPYACRWFAPINSDHIQTILIDPSRFSQSSLASWLLCIQGGGMDDAFDLPRITWDNLSAQQRNNILQSRSKPNKVQSRPAQPQDLYQSMRINKLGSLTERLGSLTNRLGSVNDKMDILTPKLVNMANKAGSVANTVGSLTSKIESLNSVVGSLITKLGDLNTKNNPTSGIDDCGEWPMPPQSKTPPKQADKVSWEICLLPVTCASCFGQILMLAFNTISPMIMVLP